MRCTARLPAAACVLAAAVLLATLTDAVASTALALGRADLGGDIHVTPDEFAWLDVGYGAADLTVLHDADHAFAVAVSFVAGAVLFGSADLIPALAVSLLGFTPTDAGLLLLPSGGLFAVTLLLPAWLVQRRGKHPIATVPSASS